MGIFLYVIGALFAALSFVVSTPVIALVAAAFYLSNDLMSRMLTTTGVLWYVYFASVLAGFGIYLFAQGSNYLLLSAAACFVAAAVTMLASKQAFFGGWFSHTYDQWFGLTHPLIFIPIFFYLALNLK